MNLNKIQIIGRLTKQPELRLTPSGTQVCTFSVATNHVWKNDGGEKQEKVTFHNVVTFGRTAEVIAQYFVKGQEIYIEGRQEHETYDKKDGSGKGYRSQIIAERFDFGQKPKGEVDEQFDNYGKEPEGNSGEEFNPDDIPF
jgi:single-strand DNA-binding protein